MARTPPAVVAAAASEFGLRHYLGRYAQRLTVVACWIEGFAAAGLLLSLIFSVVNVLTGGGDAGGPAPSEGTAPGVAWGPLAALGALGTALVVQVTLMARHRVY